MTQNKTTIVFKGSKQDVDLALKGIVEIIRANECIITSVYDDASKRR